MGGYLSQGGIVLNDLFQGKETTENPYITKTDLNGYITPDKIRIYSTNDCILYFTRGDSNYIAVNPSTNIMRYNSVGNLHQFNQNVSVTGTMNATTLQQGAVNVNDLFQAKETALNPYITKTDLNGYITPSIIRIANTSTTTLVDLNVLYFTPYANIFIGVQTSTNAMIFSAYGYYFNNGSNNVAQITTTGSYVTVSDRRLKKNINDLSYGLHEILQLNSVSYHLLEEEEEPLHIGFIAQDLKPIMPELVTEIGDYSGIQYTSLIPVLVNAIKELSSQVDELKSLINNKK